MAIDVKAEAERIISGRSFSPHQAGGMIADVMYLASRVRAEAVEQACKAVCWACAENKEAVFADDDMHAEWVHRIPHLQGVTIRTCDADAIRAAFAEPGSPPESPDSSPGALRQFVDAAVRLADAHMEYPASGHPDDMADTETILRLASQFKEPKP